MEILGRIPRPPKTANLKEGWNQCGCHSSMNSSHSSSEKLRTRIALGIGAPTAT